MGRSALDPRVAGTDADPTSDPRADRGPRVGPGRTPVGFHADHGPYLGAGRSPFHAAAEVA